MMTNNYNLRPFKLKPVFAERVWGRRDLKPWFAETGLAGPVGEAWLTGAECVIDGGDENGRTLGDLSNQCVGTLDGVRGGGEFPLLVKLLFPDEKLSVQVHPNDAEARGLGLARGKTECWYVLEASLGARVACGLRSGKSIDDLRAAIAAGSAEDLLEWLPVDAGDMVFVDAGTVHAIGPDMTLLEVQQNCDVTYRLFDYGRDRELHLEEGLKVAKSRTSAGKVKPKKMNGFTRLLEAEHFVVDGFDIPAAWTFEMGMDGVGCVVGLTGEGAVNEVRFSPGQAVVAPSGSVTMSSVDGASFLRIWEPSVTKGI